MVRVFVTGSSDGIGLAAAKLLASHGHQVTLHARNASRAAEAQQALPAAERVLVADISNVAGAKDLAAQANASGPWDCVVHNAGLGFTGTKWKTEDGIAATFAVNTLAPYVITSLMEKPKRLLYLSSSLHMSGDANLEDVTWAKRWERHDAMQAYSDTKLHDVMLAEAVARRWPDVQSCSLDPGWVKTKMGGSGAPGTTEKPAGAIAEFAAGTGVTSGQTGVYFNPSGIQKPHKGALRDEQQDRLITLCEEMSGSKLAQ